MGHLCLGTGTTRQRDESWYRSGIDRLAMVEDSLKAFEMRGRYEEGLLGSGVPDDW